MNKQIIRRRNARRLWAIPLLVLLAVAVFLASGIMTAKADTRAIGGGTDGTATCTLQNSAGGDTVEITISYERTSKELLMPDGTKKNVFVWTVTLPEDVVAKTNLRCSDDNFLKGSDGKFRWETSSLSKPNFSELVFIYDEVLQLPEEPTKEGYHFVGWYLDEELTIPYQGEPITADMQFYAKFEINEYTVTLDGNGGSDVSNVTVEWNTSAELPTPTKEGYNFVGWFYGNGTKYEGQVVTENITLTAHWELKVYTVTFYHNGEVYKTMQVPHGTLLRNIMSQDRALRYMNALNERGEKLPKTATVKGNAEVAVGEMTQEEKYAEFLSRNMWLIYSLGGIACAGVLATVIASVVAYKRK